MDLHQLRTFVAIAEEGNLTRASERLFMSQPAASAHIRLLESELELKLFFRTPRGMELTPAGKILLQEAKITLDAARNLQAQASNLHEQSFEQQLHLGIVCVPSILRITELLGLLAERHAGLSVALSQGISGDIVERIRNGSLDAGYVIGAVEDPLLICQEVSSISLRIAAPPSYKDKIKGATWEQIADLPWITTPEKCSFSKISSRMFAVHGVKPRNILEADQEMTLQQLVSSGLGLTLLREEAGLACEANGELVLWDGHVEQENICIIYRRADEQRPALMYFLEAVRSVWKIESPSIG